jgi:hypothetical protein
VYPDYTEQNVYRLWNENDNYHKNVNEAEKNANGRLMEAAPIGDEISELVLDIFQPTKCGTTTIWPSFDTMPTLEEWQAITKKAREFRAKKEGRG